MIRTAHGDGAHDRPLAAVAVAAGAEDADQPALAEVACRLQDDVEGVRCMRVVDDDRERLPLVDRLEPSRHPRQRPDPFRELVLVDVEEDPRRDHTEHVLDVEPPSQRRLDVDSTCAKRLPDAPTTSPSGRISAAR